MITTLPTITLVQLSRIEPTPPPDAGEKWVGVKHFELLKALRVGVEALGMHCLHKDVPIFALSRDHADFATVREVKWDDARAALHTLSFGVIHSNERRRSFAVYAGIHDDSAPIVLAEHVIGRRSGDFNLKERLDLALASVFATVQMIPEIKRTLVKTAYSVAEYQEMLLTLARENVIPWSRLNELDSACRDTAADFTGINAWTMLTKTSRVLRLSPPLEQMHLRFQAYRLISRQCQTG